MAHCAPPVLRLGDSGKSSHLPASLVSLFGLQKPNPVNSLMEYYQPSLIFLLIGSKQLEDVLFQGTLVFASALNRKPRGHHLLLKFHEF